MNIELQKKMHAMEFEIKILNLKSKPHEQFYQTISFQELLVVVVNNLRTQGRYTLANQIQELGLYVIGLEKIKASGIYQGTEMEKTLDNNIKINKTKLITIINQLIA